METEDQSNTPIKPDTVPGVGGPLSGAPLSDSHLGAMLKIGLPPQSQRAGGAWQPPAPEELQRDFPQYEIRGILGRGGMGAVYKGWQKSLDRFVAIKILPPGLDGGDVDFTARFKREAKAMAQLKHNGIVAVHDTGQTAGGLLYFVMEHVEGTDVQRLVALRGRLEPAEALRITSAVCDALAYAHGQGFVHRDIKPSNIMIETGGTVKVADFGLAKSNAPEATMLTTDGISVGTPDFMAPESFKGAAHVDHRADIYAVGVMLYQMLTGRIPRGRFDGPSGVVREIDPRLDAVVDKAMQTDREKRYSSAAEIRADTERILAHPSVAAVAQRRGKVMLGIAFTASLVLAAGGVVWWSRSGGAPGGDLRHAGESPAKSPGEEAFHRLGLDASGSSAIAGTSATLVTAAKDAPFINSLGMKFVPVPIQGGPTGGQRVLFSVWDTRVQDYEAFVKETKREWKPDFLRDATLPAINVSWEDAQLFCQWLTGRERASGRLPTGWNYRLPSDHEWSCAAELGAREDAAKLPSEKNVKINDTFPWGTQWPPPEKAGNYAGEELQPFLTAGRYPFVTGVIAGYHDGYATTSPVGSFAANRFGLFDMGGNVWQWCEDWFDDGQKDRVLRGASWAHGARDNLLSSRRSYNAPTARYGGNGFRCVLSASAPAGR